MNRWVPALTAVIGLAVGAIGAAALNDDDGGAPEPDSSRVLPATVSPPVQAEACRTILAVAANVHVKRGEMWKVEVVSADGHHFGGPIRFDRAPVGPAIFSLGIPADYQRQPGDSRAPRVEGSHKVRVFDPRGRLVAEGDVGIVRERPGPPEESGCQSAAAAVK